MSGQAGGRGYLVQAIIAVLDSLDEHDWSECVLEPNIGEDKIDLLLRSSIGDRVSQIKSSKNAIGAAQVQAWAEALESSYPGALQYKLRLIGPITSGVTTNSFIGKVEIPVPESLNMGALLSQCAHRLDKYLREIGFASTRPVARELLAEGLATRLGTFSANGKAISRESLNKLLAEWVMELVTPDISDGTSIPHQLPGAPTDFVGRLTELKVLRDAVERENVRVILIRGMTGIGKSVLAAKVAEELTQLYSDGQIFLETRAADLSPIPTVRLLTNAIQSIKLSYPSSDDCNRCLADYRTLLNTKRVLIFAENVDSENQIESLIPPSASSLLIITTQSRFDLPGALSLDLDFLSENDCIELITSIAPKIAGSSCVLARICGYLPLAIRIAAGTLNARPDISIGDFVLRLEGIKEKARLVRVALEISLFHAADEMKDFLSAAAVFPSDFDADAISAVWGKSDEKTDMNITAALRRHLVAWDNKLQRYIMHDLIRAYFIDITSDKQLSNFLSSHACYYASCCTEVDRLYREQGESVFSALALFDAENVNIAAGFFFSASHAGSEKHAAEICNAFVRGMTHVMDLRLTLIARAEVLTAGLLAANTIGDKGLLVLHTGNLGRVYRELGKYDDSIKCHKWVLEMAVKAGFPEDQAYALHHIGLAMLDKGEENAGIENLNKAIQLIENRSLDLCTLKVATLNNLGTAYLKAKQPTKALGSLKSALELQGDHSDPRMLSLTLLNLGTILASQDAELAVSIDMLEKAVGIAEDLGDEHTIHKANLILEKARLRYKKLHDGG
jgi:tetratricopeptide (TPR) repeat protein